MARMSESRKREWDEIMRRSIYGATVELLNDRGLAGLTMERVAKRAEVSTGTLYNYVKDKDDLLAHVVDTAFEPVREVLDRICGGTLSPPAKLRAFVSAMFRGFDDNRAVIAVIYQAASNAVEALRRKASIQETLLDLATGILSEGVDQGYFRQCDKALFGRLIIATMDGYFLSLLEEGDKIRVGQIEALACADLLLNGLLVRSQADTGGGPNASKRGK